MVRPRTRHLAATPPILERFHGISCSPTPFRASRAAMLLPEASRLAWLAERDIAERAVWASLFREGEDTLGQIVQSVMEKRSAHWDTPILNTVMRQTHRPILPIPRCKFSSPGLVRCPRSRSIARRRGQARNRHSQRRGEGLAAMYPCPLTSLAFFSVN